MTFRVVEKLSESTLQILCGKCIKEARILWSQRPSGGIDSNHMLLVTCHGEARMVMVEEFQVVMRRAEKVDGEPPQRIQLTWESLSDVDDEYLEQIRSYTAEYLQEAQDRLVHIEKFKKLRETQQAQKPTSRFEALAHELEE